jgi:hypothetical protein
MEPFKIDLNQSTETGSKYKRFIFTLAIVYFLSSLAAFFIFYSKNDPVEWVFVGAAVWGLIMFSFAFIGSKAKLYLRADDFAIEYQFGFLVKTPNAIIWETVKKVKLGPTYITFFKLTGKGKKVTIGWLPYAKVIEIKEKIKQYAESKGIPTEIGELVKID